MIHMYIVVSMKPRKQEVFIPIIPLGDEINAINVNIAFTTSI